RVTIIFLLVVPFTTGGAGQRRRPVPANRFVPELEAELTRLHQAAPESGYAYGQLAHLTEQIGPRLSGSAQAAAAVQYVADELKRLGLEVRLEAVSVPHWVRGIESGEIVQFPGQVLGITQRIVLTALGGSVATPADGLTAEVVVVDDFAQLN